MTGPPVWVRAARQVIRRLPAGRYQAIEWLCRGRSDTFVARFGGAESLDFACDLRDAIAREVCFTGGYGPQETRLFHALLRPGMTVADIGANWGYFTLLAASIVGARGRVLALEPEPRLFALLEENVRLNALANIVALRLAATDRRATLGLSVYDDSQSNRGVSVVTTERAAAAIDADGRSVDELATERGIWSIDLVKIDVEGHEPEVVDGMRDGLRAGRYRRLLIEWHLSTPAAQIEASFARLMQSGYRGWWIDHSVEATRAAAYGAPPRLSPIATHAFRDAWPHTLWVGHGEPDPPVA